MQFTYAAGRPEPKRSFLGTKCRQKEGGGPGTEKFKACGVKLEGHSLTACVNT